MKKVLILVFAVLALSSVTGFSQVTSFTVPAGNSTSPEVTVNRNTTIRATIDASNIVETSYFSNFSAYSGYVWAQNLEFGVGYGFVDEAGYSYSGKATSVNISFTEPGDYWVYLHSTGYITPTWDNHYASEATVATEVLVHVL